MKVIDFDFPLPEELIAKEPSEKRDDSRLLVVKRGGTLESRRFHNLKDYINEGDMLLLNDTKVFPARLKGKKPTGGEVDFLLVREAGRDRWEIIKKKKYNGRLLIADGFSAVIEDGVANFSYSGDFMENLWRHGDMPLPPYIKRRPGEKDKERYQTVYAESEGSIAGPTAGIHFSEELLGDLRKKGVLIRCLTLHIGIGTFRPIRTEVVEDHLMHPEYFEIGEELICEIKKLKGDGKRIISVGTTTTRAIEGYMSGRWVEVQQKGSRGQGIKGSRVEIKNVLEPSNPQTLEPSKVLCGTTDIFIYPGYEFKAIDSLVTNFHLPRSTPLMLTSAFCGIDRLKEAYSMAITHKYRFFSYGDAMLIL